MRCWILSRLFWGSLLGLFFCLMALQDVWAASKTITATLKGKPFTLEVAQTPAELERGLMFRRVLGKNHGMLFVFRPPQTVAFWMKNCLIPLDMVFLQRLKNEMAENQATENGAKNPNTFIIQGLRQNVPPCRQEPCPLYASGTTPDDAVDFVLELKAGTIQRLKLRAGDSLNLPVLLLDSAL